MHTLSVESIINIDFIEVMLGSLPQNNPEFCSFEKWNQVMVMVFDALLTGIFVAISC